MKAMKRSLSKMQFWTNLRKKMYETQNGTFAPCSSLWLLILLAELNQLEIWTTYVGNAYLEACTQEML